MTLAAREWCSRATLVSRVVEVSKQQQQAEGTAPKLHPRTPVSHPEKRDRELQQESDKHHHHGRQAALQGNGPVCRQQAEQVLDFDGAPAGETGKRRDGWGKPVLRGR